MTNQKETEAERSKREREAIESNEYLTVLEEGEFEGFHWTNPSNRFKIQGKDLKGCPWDRDLGFTRSTPDLCKNGAVFAFTGLRKSEGQDWGPQAIVFRVQGHGYLVRHSQEGLQYIFRADQAKAEFVGSLAKLPTS
jgi:hypothetical protein